MGDSRRTVPDERIIELLRSGLRPVWTSTSLAEELDITRQTANARLKQLEEKSEDVVSINVGQATAYYVPGTDSLPPGETLEERHKQSIIHEFTDRFVGLETKPWTAVHPNDGPAEGGDKIQIRVHGEPGRWSKFMVHTWENRREELHPDELEANTTQALISGELYEKPTVPIEHTNYPDDYDLELNIGAKFKGDPPKQALIATGVKNYLIRPVDDAVFLKNVNVDWISPKGKGKEVETVEITEEMIEDVEEWRQEHVEDDPDPI